MLQLKRVVVDKADMDTERPFEAQVYLCLFACRRGHVHLLRGEDKTAQAQVVGSWEERPDVVEATRDQDGQLAFCPIPIRETYRCDRDHVHVRHSNGAGTFEDFWSLERLPGWLKWSEDQVCRDDAGRFASCGGDDGGGSGRTREGRQREQAARLEHAHTLVKGILTGDRPVPTDRLKELHDHLGKLTVPQLHQLRQHYGLKAPGRLKDKLKEGIASRLAGMAGGQPRPEAKVEPGTFGLPKDITWIGSEGEHKRLAEAILGAGSTREQLAACAGTVDGSKVELHDAGMTSDGRRAVGVRFYGRSAEGDAYSGSRRLILDSNGSKRIYNASFEGKGAGLEMFAREVENATLHGFSEIKTHAAGYRAAYNQQYGSKSTFNGYYTWPRFGYDQKIEDHHAAKVPPELRPQLEAAGGKVSGLMSTQEGRDWWKENGSDLDSMKFDLTPGSYSQRTLKDYLKERGVTKTAPWGVHAILDLEGNVVDSVTLCDRGHLHVRLLLAHGGLATHVYPANAPPAWLKWSEDQVCRDDHGRFATCGGEGSPDQAGAGRRRLEREARSRERVAHAHRLIGDIKSGDYPPKHADLMALNNHLEKLTVQELHQVKQHHGLRASGPTKAALAARITTRLVQSMPPDTPRPDAKVEPGTFGVPKNLKFDDAASQREADRIAGDVLGSGAKAADLAGCAGVIDGAHVSFSRYGQTVNVRFIGNADGEQFNGDRTITIHGDGSKSVHNNLFEGKSSGLRMFARQVENATKHGFDHIETFAAGHGGGVTGERNPDSHFNGYYTWPRFGYDDKIPGHIRQNIPAEFRPAVDAAGGNVRGLMGTQAGRDWWLGQGAGLHNATFDLTPGSYSQRTLTAYLKERGVTKAGPWGVHAVIDPQGSPVANVTPCNLGHLHVRLLLGHGAEGLHVYQRARAPAWLKWSEDQVCRDDHGRFAPCGGGSDSAAGGDSGRTGHAAGERERRAQEKLDRAHELIKLMMDGAKPIPDDKVKELAEHMGGMTVAHLQKIKEHYGLKASGKNKEALRDRLVARFVDKIHDELGDHSPVAQRPEEWQNAEAGETWGKDTFAGWVGSLTGDEQQAVRTYKDESLPVNTHLRNGGTAANAPATVASTIAHLDTALAAGKTDRDVIVYRGARRTTADRILASLGGTFEDKAYQSSSVDKDIADNFARQTASTSTRLIMSIHVPKGSRGAYIDGVPNIENDYEGEFLLPRGTRLHILSAEQADDRIWHVKARVAS